MKRTRALLMTALPLTLLAATLAGCSVGGSGVSGNAITADASGTDCIAGGDASKAVTVEGDFGAEVALTSKTPVAKVEGTQRTVLIDGDTTPFAEGDTSTVSVTIFNGTSGEVINYVDSDQLPNDAELLAGADWALQSVRCGAPGQRVVIVAPAGEAMGQDPADLGFTDLAADDSLVFVIDFAEPFEELADCETVTPRDKQYPEVDLGDGASEPKITIPECMEAPEELELEVLVEGDGAVVEADQKIMTNYVGVFWNGAERFDGSWNETGVVFSTAAGALIEGFTQAMVGQKIGSTILVTVPSELGYNDGNTRTFVLQLVGAAPAE